MLTCSSHNFKTILHLNICLISSIWIRILLKYLSNICKTIWVIMVKNLTELDNIKCFMTATINLLSHPWWIKMAFRHTTMIFKIHNKLRKDLKNLKNPNNKIRSLTISWEITKMERILIISKTSDFSPLI